MHDFGFLKLVVSLVPPVVLLTVSFFVLFTLRKVDSKGLKIFGRVIVLLLWIVASVVCLTGIYTLSKGFCPPSSSKWEKFCPHSDFSIDPHHKTMMDPHHEMMERQAQ
jgi:hypothetical protein